jgi:hypothetical protein
MQTITSPSDPTLYLDDRRVIHATDDSGKIVLHEETGKPVQIAQDLITGKWYAKLTDSMPFSNRDKTKLKEFIDAGAVHVAHSLGSFRGVWVPCADAKPVAKAKGNA